MQRDDLKFEYESIMQEQSQLKESRCLLKHRISCFVDKIMVESEVKTQPRRLEQA